MAKKWRYLIFVLLLVVPLVLAACGGDDDDDNGDNGDNGDVELTQDFTSADGISFQYPEGWVASDQEGQVFVANSQTALDKMIAGGVENNPTEGEAAFLVTGIPLDMMGVDAASASLDDVFTQMTSAMTGEGMTTEGDVQDIELGDTDAKKINVSDDTSSTEGVIVGMIDSDGAFIMLVGVAPEGERGNVEDTVMAVAETVDWAAPAAE